MSDAWLINPHATIETIRRQIPMYKAELKAAGKSAPRELPLIKEIYCARDRKTALEMGGPYLLAKYRDYAKWGQDKVMPDNTDFAQSFEELVQGRFILGSPEECYKQLEPYWKEFGVNHIVLRMHWAGHAALHLARQHAADLGRAAAGTAQGMMAQRLAGFRCDRRCLPLGPARREP